MTRAINVMATEAELVKICADQGVAFSMMEPLKSGGTRLVMNNSIDATTLRGKLKRKLINGPVERSGSYIGRQQISYR